MTIPHIFLALSFAGMLAAQTFIQMSDPDLGASRSRLGRCAPHNLLQ